MTVVNHRVLCVCAREFNIVDTRDESSHLVKHFQYTDWPESLCACRRVSHHRPHWTGPEVAEELWGQTCCRTLQVNTHKQTNKQTNKHTHTSGGCGRTGTYIAVSILIERLKTEGVVDVFQTVRKLRLQSLGWWLLW